jgi:hypothetical protein
MSLVVQAIFFHVLLSSCQTLDGKSSSVASWGARARLTKWVDFSDYKANFQD